MKYAIAILATILALQTITTEHAGTEFGERRNYFYSNHVNQLTGRVCKNGFFATGGHRHEHHARTFKWLCW